MASLGSSQSPITLITFDSDSEASFAVESSCRTGCACVYALLVLRCEGAELSWCRKKSRERKIDKWSSILNMTSISCCSASTVCVVLVCVLYVDQSTQTSTHRLIKRWDFLFSRRHESILYILCSRWESLHTIRSTCNDWQADLVFQGREVTLY